MPVTGMPMKENVQPELPEEQQRDPEPSKEKVRSPRSQEPGPETVTCDCPPGCVGLPCCTGAR